MVDHEIRTRLRHAARCSASRNAVCDRICEALERGVGLAAAADRERIALRTLGRWLADDSEFHARYERALRRGHERLAEEIIVLADSGQGPPGLVRRRIAVRKWLFTESRRRAARADAGKRKAEAHPTEAEIAMMQAALKRIRDAPPEHDAEWKGILAFTPDSPNGEPIWRTPEGQG
jgi:hypothetical protein